MLHIFKKLTYIFAIIFMAQAINTQAVIIEAWATISQKNDRLFVCWGDMHSIPHKSTDRHIDELLQFILRYNRKDVCIIIEAPEYLKNKAVKKETQSTSALAGTEKSKDSDGSQSESEHELSASQHEKAALKYDNKTDLLAFLAAKCENEKIEVHRVDFRKVYNEKTEEIADFYGDPKNLSVEEFIKIIEDQITLITKAHQKILNDAQYQMWKDIQTTCKHAFDKKKLSDFYTYCQTLTPSDLLNYRNIIEFISTLIDARIIAHAITSQKKVVVIIAGVKHAQAVLNQLQQQQNHELLLKYSQKDLQGLIERAVKTLGKEPGYEADDKEIPVVNIKEFVSKLDKQPKSKTDESKKDTESLSAPSVKKIT